MRIKNKISIWISIVLLPCLFIFSFFTIDTMRNIEEQRLIDKIDIVTISIAKPLSLLVWNVDIDGAEFLCNSFLEDKEICEVKVSTETGVLIDEKKKGYEVKYSSTKDLIYFDNKQKKHKIGIVTMSITDYNSKKNIKNFGTRIFIFAFFVTIVLIIILSLVLLRVFKPINNMMLALNEIASGSFDINIPASKDYEIRLLRDGIMEMSKKIRNVMVSIQNLLDNSDQGFLTFGSDFCVDREYSKECINIFHRKIFGLNVLELLYPKDIVQQNMQKSALQKYFKDSNQKKTLTFDMTLNKEIKLHKKDLELKYTLFEQDSKTKILLRISNTTEIKKLIEKMNEEKVNFSLLVNATTQKNKVIAVLNKGKVLESELISTIDSQDNALVVFLEIVNKLRLLKSEFDSLSLFNSAKSLIEFQTIFLELKNDTENFNTLMMKSFVKNSDIDEFTKKDIDIISNILGSDFLSESEEITLSKSELIEMEQKVREGKNILVEFKRLTQESINDTVKKSIVEGVKKNDDVLQLCKYEITGEIIYDDLNKLKNILNVVSSFFIQVMLNYRKNEFSLEMNFSKDAKEVTINILIKEVEFDSNLPEKDFSSQKLVSALEENSLRIGDRIVNFSFVKSELNNLNGKWSGLVLNQNSYLISINIPYFGFEALQKIDGEKVLSYINSASKDFFEEELGIPFDESNAIEEQTDEVLNVLEVSSFINIEGLVKGEIIISMDSILTKEILKVMIPEELSETEQKEYIGEVTNEITNIIAGRTLSYFSEFEGYVNIDYPTTIFSDNSSLKFPGRTIWKNHIPIGNGNIILCFIKESEI